MIRALCRISLCHLAVARSQWLPFLGDGFETLLSVLPGSRLGSFLLPVLIYTVKATEVKREESDRGNFLLSPFPKLLGLSDSSFQNLWALFC